MPLINYQLAFAFLWIVVCAAAFFWLLRRGTGPLPALGYAVAAAFFLRLLPALFLPRGAEYEMWVFRQTGALLRAGGDVYTSELAHPYLPLQLYWFAAAGWLAETIGLSFTFWLKFPSLLADSALVILVYQAVSVLGRGAGARQAAWLYALNPVTILVAAYQGQFDAIPLFFLLLAWYFFNSRQRPYHLLLSALALGVAVLSKTWPVIFLPIAFLRLQNWRARLAYPLLVGLIPLGAVLLYAWLFPGSLFTLLRRSLGAGAIPGWWGYSAPLNVFVTLTGLGGNLYQQLVTLGKPAGLLAGLATILLTWRRRSLYALLLTVLVLFATVPNLGLQSLSWVVPLALIWGVPNRLGWYVAGVFLHMIVSYWGLHLNQTLYALLPRPDADSIIQLSSLFAWLPILIWLVEEGTGRSLFPRWFPSVRRHRDVAPAH